MTSANPKPTWRAALLGAAAAIAVAAIVNGVITLLAGETLRIPGEMGLPQVLMFTVVMVVPTAVLLKLLPRWFAVIVMTVAVLTISFAWSEFGAPVVWWLGAMHLVTGACAAVIAPRVAGLDDTV